MVVVGVLRLLALGFGSRLLPLVGMTATRVL